MFNLRPLLPWPFVSPEDEERERPGFNVEAPLLAGFIQAAQDASTSRQPEDDYEIQIPPGLSGGLVEDDRPPMSPPEDSPSDTSEGEPYPEPAPFPGPPFPSPTPAPAPPSVWRDWVSEALDQIASIHETPRPAPPHIVLPRASEPMPQARRSNAWNDFRSDSHWKDSPYGLDPRFIVRTQAPSNRPPYIPPVIRTPIPPAQVPQQVVRPPVSTPLPQPTQQSGVGASGRQPTTTPDGNAIGTREPQQASPADPGLNRHGIGGNFPPPGPLPTTPNPTTGGRTQAKPMFVGPLRAWLETVLPYQAPIGPSLPEPVAPAEEVKPAKQAPAAPKLRPIEDPYGLEEHLEYIKDVIAPRGGDPLAGMIVPSGGALTGSGVQLHPKLPVPGGGILYVPENTLHARGYKGELHLANRIVMRIPGEVVIRYGNKARANGPDIISISKDGDITIWDSKWRTAEQSITDSNRAHKGQNAIPILQDQLLEALQSAKGQLDPEVYRRALANAQQGNFFIATVGTGNAHDAVIEEVRNGQRVLRKRARASGASSMEKE